MGNPLALLETCPDAIVVECDSTDFQDTLTADASIWLASEARSNHRSAYEIGAIDPWRERCNVGPAPFAWACHYVLGIFLGR